jgi:catechol 2,3-dioxygenase-like lactoylglutathione lyase family enzyme
VPNPPFVLVQIDHVVLRVRDVQRALDFYCGVLGCTEERRVMQFGLVQLRAGASLIDLLDGAQSPDPNAGRNMDHFALTISPFDEAALRAHLAGHGVEMAKIEQRYGAMGVGPSIYIHDPDGNQVELKGPPN